MRRMWSFLTIVATVLSALVLGVSGSPAVSANDEFEPLDAPRRIVDTRSSGTTDDGLFARIGAIRGGQVLEVDVAGRAGVPEDAEAVVLNVTVVRASARGFVAVYPCDQPRPNGSNINYARRQVIANAVFARLDGSGRTCIFVRSTTDLVVDVTGTLPGSSFEALPAPARVLDTRPVGEVLDDDQRFEKTGRNPAGTSFELQVAGRAGVPPDATTAVLNVAAVQPDRRGFVTVYPCDQPRPVASNLNYRPGRVVANSVVARLDPNGRTCIFSRTTTHLVVDVTGTLPATTFTPLESPARIHDSRDIGETVDDIAEKTGARRPGTTLELPVAGRARVPVGASAVMLNVTVIGSQGPGFVTAHPRNSSRPNASNLNHAAGEVIANSVVAKVGGNGEICFFNRTYTDLVIDVTGYFAGPAPVDTGEGCPQEFPAYVSTDSSDRESQHHLVGEFQMPPGRYVGTGTRADGFGTCDVFKYAFFGNFLDNDNGSRGFLGTFRNQRVIVDVQPTDRFVSYRGFDCTPLSPYEPGAGPRTMLGESGGMHIVGDHIDPGTYEIVGTPCFVTRMRSFTGLRSIDRIETIDSLFAGGAGVTFTIQPTDAGVWMQTSCGIRKL